MSFRAALHIVLISAAFIYTISPGLILAQTKTLVINEVMASNGHSHWDEDGDYEDWIELYNNTPTTIDLEGYGLSDDCDYPFKWTFPNVSIEAGDFILIWASGKDRRNSEAPLHTNYSISAAGEEILLTDVDGKSGIKIDLYNALGQKIRDPEIHPSDANGWLVLKINQPGIHYLVLRNLNGDILSSEKVLVF